MKLERMTKKELITEIKELQKTATTLQRIATERFHALNSAIIGNDQLREKLPPLRKRIALLEQDNKVLEERKDFLVAHNTSLKQSLYWSISEEMNKMSKEYSETRWETVKEPENG